jgi:predicted PurR-regulated permease PerM
MIHKAYKYLLHNQVILALVIFALGWLVMQMRGILVSIFIAYIIMAALTPAVDYFKKKRWPAFAAVTVPFLATIFFIILIVLPLVPFFMSQVKSLATDLPSYLNESARTLGFDINEQEFQEIVTREFNSIGRNAFNVTRQVFGGVFSTLTILIISFYLLLYKRDFKNAIANMFHPDSHDKVIQTIDRIDDKLGAWLRGQIILCLFIGSLTWIVLTIIGIPFALPLAVLAGLLEIVPTLGPILAAVPAIIVAITVSPPFALSVGGIYAAIQLLENNILVPKIMERAVGLNPVVVILAVMIGANLMGIAGALLAIPFVSLVIVIFNTVNDIK